MKLAPAIFSGLDCPDVFRFASARFSNWLISGALTIGRCMGGPGLELKTACRFVCALAIELESPLNLAGCIRMFGLEASGDRDVALPISGGDEGRTLCSEDCSEASELCPIILMGGLLVGTRSLRLEKNKGVLPAKAAPSGSDLFRFLDTVEASEGVGELDLFGDDVPSLITFGLDSPSSSKPIEAGVGSVFTMLELWCSCTKLGLDSRSSATKDNIVGSVVMILELLWYSMKFGLDGAAV